MRKRSVKLKSVYRHPALGLVRVLRENRPFWSVIPIGERTPYNFVRHVDLRDNVGNEELQQFIRSLP